jgi:hypothetical protein
MRHSKMLKSFYNSNIDSDNKIMWYEGTGISFTRVTTATAGSTLNDLLP